MATGFEVALVKPVVDAIVAIFKKAKTSDLKRTAEKSLSDAIRELLLSSPNLKSAEAKIAVAKAAGIINEDLILAEEMVAKCYTTKKIPMTAMTKFATKKAAKARPAHAIKAVAKAVRATKVSDKAKPAVKSAAKAKARKD